MENEITVTLRYTSLEDSMLLLAGGVSPETADMMFECLPGRDSPKVYVGFSRRSYEYYPEYYKPCWSEQKLRVMCDNMGHRGMVRDVNSLVPILLSLYTMREAREYKQKKLDTMKLDELMVGDWVYLEDGETLVKIIALPGKSLVTLQTKDENITTSFCEELKPVPLSEDILSKNGFEVTMEGTNYSGRFVIYQNRSITDFNFYYNVSDHRLLLEDHCKIRICNVHELQNFMRMIKCEKQIELCM